MTTQLSTSAGLGHFLAIELPNNEDQKQPKDEKMNCVDTTVTQSPERDTDTQTETPNNQTSTDKTE